MKMLTVVGQGGFILAHVLIDVEGENFSSTMTLPLFLPIVHISLLDVDKEAQETITEAIEKVKEMVS